MGATSHGHHYYRLFDTCQRQFWWQSLQGVVPKRVNPQASLGRMIHHAMYYLFQGNPLEQALEAAKAEEIKELVDKGLDYDVEATQEVVREFERLMGWYAQWTPKHPLTMVEGELEGEFAIPGIPDPYTYRIDSIGRDERGQLWVVDVKSTKKTFPNLFRGFEMDYQMMGYVLGARSRGIPVKGAVIRGFRKLKRVKVPEELFQDEKFQYSNAQLEEFKYSLLEVHFDLVHRGDGDKEIYRKNPDQCFSVRGECPYYSLCRYPETEQQTLAAYFTKKEEVDDADGGAETQDADTD
jgi:hypothetical protein